MADKRTFPIGTLVLGGVFVLVMLSTYLLVKPATPPPELQGVIRPEFRPIMPFELTDHEGRPFTENQLQNKWTFVFFGYTSCPDICPNTLYVLNSVQGLQEDKAGADAINMQVVFISVDPQRDSTEKLAKYMRYFNKKFTGATAGKTKIDGLTRQFNAGYIVEPETSPGQYLVAHTSAIFLVDPYGRLVATFSQPHYASTLLSQYKKITAYFSGTG